MKTDLLFLFSMLGVGFYILIGAIFSYPEWRHLMTMAFFGFSMGLIVGAIFTRIRNDPKTILKKGLPYHEK